MSRPERSVPVEFTPKEVRSLIAALDVTRQLVASVETKEQHRFLIRRLKAALEIDRVERQLYEAKS